MSELRTLATGRGLVESPRWHGDRLYFSHWCAGEVVAVDLAGHSEVIARVESLPLSTAWLPDQRLVWAELPGGGSLVSSIAWRGPLVPYTRPAPNSVSRSEPPIPPRPRPASAQEDHQARHSSQDPPAKARSVESPEETERGDRCSGCSHKTIRNHSAESAI